MTENASAKTQSPAPHSEPVNGNDEQQLRQTWAQQQQLMWVHTGLSPSVQESLPRMQQKQMGDHVSMSGHTGMTGNWTLVDPSLDDSKSRGSTPEQDEPKTKVKKTPSQKVPTGLPERLPT